MTHPVCYCGAEDNNCKRQGAFKQGEVPRRLSALRTSNPLGPPQFPHSVVSRSSSPSIGRHSKPCASFTALVSLCSNRPLQGVCPEDQRDASQAAMRDEVLLLYGGSGRAGLLHSGHQLKAMGGKAARDYELAHAVAAFAKTLDQFGRRGNGTPVRGRGQRGPRK